MELLKFLGDVWSNPWHAVIGDCVIAVVTLLLGGHADQEESIFSDIVGTVVAVVGGISAIILSVHTMWHTQNFLALGVGTVIAFVLAVLSSMLLWEDRVWTYRSGVIILWVGTLVGVIELILMLTQTF